MLCNFALKVWAFLLTDIFNCYVDRSTPPSEGTMLSTPTPTTLSIAPTQSTSPICAECVPKDKMEAPGVGFYLSYTYATVSVRYHNGTAVDIGRYEYTNELKDVFKKWRTFDITPAFCAQFPQSRCDSVLAERELRKSMMIPSTNDIQLLATFLFETFRDISGSAPILLTANVVVGHPYLSALDAGDFEEALDWSQLKYLRSYEYSVALYGDSAAFAGMGYGLCEHWTDSLECRKEEASLPSKNIIAIEFDYSVDGIYFYSSKATSAHNIQHSSMGSASGPSYDYYNPRISRLEYWQDIRGFLYGHLSPNAATHEVADVILLLGEDAEDRPFLDALWTSLTELDLGHLYEGIRNERFNATFGAARGAAQLAMRWQGEAWRCVEAGRCEKEKEGTRFDEKGPFAEETGKDLSEEKLELR